MVASAGMPPLHEWWPERSNTTLSEVIAIMWHGPSRKMSIQTAGGVHSWQFEPGQVSNASGAPWCDKAKASGAGGCSTVSGWEPSWQVPNAGDFLTLSPLVGYTYNVANSSQVTTHDLSVFAASNKAITEFDGEGGHIYERVKLIRKPGSDRLLAANSDAFHSSGCRAGPRLSECELSYSGDDYFNVHNTLQVVLEAGPLTSSNMHGDAAHSSHHPASQA